MGDNAEYMMDVVGEAPTFTINSETFGQYCVVLMEFGKFGLE